MKKTILFNHIFENSCGDDDIRLFTIFSKDRYVEYDNKLWTLEDVIDNFQEYVKPVDGHITKEDIINFFDKYNCVVEFVEYYNVTKYNFGVQ